MTQGGVVDSLNFIRDREHCEVFVADLPSAVTENDLRRLFKDVRYCLGCYTVPHLSQITVWFDERGQNYQNPYGTRRYSRVH